MQHLRAALLAFVPGALFFACSSTGTHTTSGSTSGGAAECPPCVTDQDCTGGGKCAQFGGDTYCAPDCGTNPTCADDRACTPLSSAEGQQVEVCVPIMNVCGGGTTTGGAGGATGSSTSGATSGSGGSNEVCGSLDGPDVTACCTSCKTSGKPCQANGCYGGWWCNVDSCGCQAPPPPCGSTSSSSSSSTSSSSSSSSSGGTGGSVGPGGGTLDVLRFAIVGDTRPALIDDTAGYPTAVIQKIWQDVEAHAPHPSFAVTTGDYMFAKPFGTQSSAQLATYLAARASYNGTVFPAMGNHECTGATASNCGQGNADGVTVNYSTFLAKMLAPLNQTLPYYTVKIGSTNNTWTAKFVFVAANAWSSAQSSWLTAELAKPTTYTFVVRHEGSIANTAPGVTPSGTIMAAHPFTLLVAGHTHTFDYYASERQIIVGNGGAPLTGSVNYGYVVGEQRSDGAIVFKAFDYSTNAVQKTFVVKADGTPTQ